MSMPRASLRSARPVAAESPASAEPPPSARLISACATARAVFDRSGSASGSQVVSCRSPRARYAAAAPLTRMTVAPTERVGLADAAVVTGAFLAAAAGPVAPGGAAPAAPGHLSAAPYGFAGSVAAR